MGLGLDFSAGFVVAVLVLKVVMGLGLDFSAGFVAAGAAKELVVVVTLGRQRGWWLWFCGGWGGEGLGYYRG
jgi:hypothetical protein